MDTILKRNICEFRKCVNDSQAMLHNQTFIILMIIGIAESVNSILFLKCSDEGDGWGKSENNFSIWFIHSREINIRSS